MILRLTNLWDALSSSLWFVPALMTLAALCLAFASITVDDATDQTSWAYGGGPQGAREVLSAIASSMMTVAGVAFSVTIVALTLASQQFGPRLLRNFMRDTGNQIVLGTFIATFTYCLIVLRTIRSGDTEFVPNISVTIAMLLALASLGVLIYFIHHVAVSIQAPEVIALVAKDLDNSIERLFPEKLGRPPEPEQQDWSEEMVKEFDRDGDTVTSTESGYLQSIDTNHLMKVATEKNLVLLLKYRPGDFLFESSELVKSKPRGSIDDETADKMQQAFILGTQRTHLQDVEFSVEQLVEVAVRALSPGINDPFTAINCIDRIAAALCLLARRSFPSAFRYDEHRNLRVIARSVDFCGIVNAAFDPIRQYGQSSAPVTIRLLEAIAMVATCARREEDRKVLLDQALMIERGSHAGLSEERDRADVVERFRSVVEALHNGRGRETEMYLHENRA
jgi:uncharacterized membrane protein